MSALQRRVMGNQILVFRLRCGLTRFGLANQVGVKMHTLDRWEDGKQVPCPENLKRLARALAVHPASIVGKRSPDAS
jgi:transcriptional regulator with XRE-family HTH domain